MKTLTESECLNLIKGGTVLKINGTGINVVRTTDGKIAKTFRPKKFFSSDLFSPRPKRFIKAVQKLTDLDIPTVRDARLYWVPFMKLHMVHYQPLEGKELRNFFAHNGYHSQIVSKWIGFLASLHEKGVYFRGINFNNIILQPDGEFGLIDVDSVRVFNHSLSTDFRARNFKPPLSYSEDQKVLCQFGLDNWIREYLDKADMQQSKEQHFLKRIRKQHPLLAKAVSTMDRNCQDL